MTANRVSKFGHQVNDHTTVLACGSSIIILPAPDFENSEKLNYTRVNRRTRGGDLKIFRADYWPKSRTFSMKWSHLPKEIRSRLLIFLRKYLGKPVTLKDYESRTSQVLINNPDTDFTEDRRDAHTVTLEFETTGAAPTVDLVFGNVMQEIPAGSVNGLNVTFMLSQTPSQPDSLQVYLNGLLQEEGIDYTFNDITTITFTDAPITGDTVLVYYLTVF